MKSKLAENFKAKIYNFGGSGSSTYHRICFRSSRRINNQQFYGIQTRWKFQSCSPCLVCWLSRYAPNPQLLPSAWYFWCPSSCLSMPAQKSVLWTPLGNDRFARRRLAHTFGGDLRLSKDCRLWTSSSCTYPCWSSR